MSSFSSHSNRFRLGVRAQQTESVKSIYSGRHATVNCQECNRIMVPRVVSYYGQPLKSICPFCGSTFMKFPSGLQRFIQKFHNHNFSLAVLKRLSIVALCFGLLWLAGAWGHLPDELSFIGTLGTIIFAALASAELVAQSIEQLAAKLAHDSKYYWSTLIIIAVAVANLHDEFTRYIVLFSFVMLVRWFIAGLAQARNPTR